ncbi:uncharacterized protein [Dysidea avara]|uniref:uncharacterized protein n=1 Tax=Dysidea avara TaxID=196820 RepID=UPI0033291898
MEQYIALHDYEKERADVLSFQQGDIFEVTSKTDLNWWAAHSLRTGEYGYVPRSYLERYVDPEFSEELYQLSISDAGDNKRVTLDELRHIVSEAPAFSDLQQSQQRVSSSSTRQSVEQFSSWSNDTDTPHGSGQQVQQRHSLPLTRLSQTPEDCHQIEPKKLPNPHRASIAHVQLHKELKFNNARGFQSTGPSELERVLRRRRPDSEGQIGPIREQQNSSRSSSTPNNELALHLKRRSDAIEESERQEIIEKDKPEFLKVNLKRTFS